MSPADLVAAAAILAAAALAAVWLGRRLVRALDADPAPCVHCGAHLPSAALPAHEDACDGR